MRKMDYNELLGKYQALIVENDRLKIEINKLKSRTPSFEQCQSTVDEASLKPRSFSVNRNSKTNDKIALFRSLFQGRTDVFAKRWQNKQGKSGSSPVCLNEWKNGACGKPVVKCSNCSNKSYKSLDESGITDHLLGRIVIGIYPMLPDETCLLLSIDFDDGNWKSDISAIRDTCNEFNIPAAFERSRSGNGAHVWFFFTDRIESSIARKFGSALITYSMNKMHEITFKSYDRFFPNQDTMPKGGLGNLIALPLQKEARKMGNSEFIDENFSAYQDQWAFLADVNKLSREMLEELIAGLCRGNELGDLKADEEDSRKPWATPKKVNLTNADFPKSISIAKANMLFVPKKDISQKALTHLKRLAAFKNPEFFKAQAMRMPTFNKPRIISCSDETEEYLCLPRGCEDDLKAVFSDLKINFKITDHTQHCRKIDVEFNGILRDEQSIAFNQLSKFDTGVLCGTTAFGKTVVALKLIAEKKVNTLILVNRKNLASQWEKKISEFLIIREDISNLDSSSQKRIKKVKSIVGIIGAGKNTANEIIDIALIQSLVKSDEVKDFVKNYGMIIVDECHHIAAFSFEQVLKTANAKFVYGLTATPARKDGHHPIIFMQCGPIKYRNDAKKQADERPFEHFIVPRFTSLKIPHDKDETDLDINNLYSEIISTKFATN